MQKGILLTFLVLSMLGSVAFADLVDNGDGTVTDTETGLMWQQIGPGTMIWDAAISYCENLDLAGYTDWRLPNVNELQSILNYEVYGPSIDAELVSASSAYWTSTVYSYDTEYAWAVDFNNGQILPAWRLSRYYVCYYVRAVRKE